MHVEKDGPVVWPDQYWEKTEYYHWHRFGSVHRRDDGTFQMWYTSNDTGYNDFLLCYAESDDGIGWEKPELGLVEYRGGASNNIVLAGDFWTGKSVWYNPISDTYQCVSVRQDGSEEPEAHHTLIRQARNSWMEILESDDGIHWDETSAETLADTLLDCHHTPLYFNEDGTGAFVARGPWEDRVSEADLNRRLYRWDYDGSEFRNPRHVLDAPGWPDQQLYTMTAVEIDDRFYGFASILNVPVDRSTTDQAEDDDFNAVDCYLAVSDDGDEWRWASDDPVIPRGPTGQWDSGQIYPLLSPVVVDDEVWVYYVGAHSKHGHLSQGEPLVTNVGLARLSVDELLEEYA